MSHHNDKNKSNESQDARRHDGNKAAHPDEKSGKKDHHESGKNQDKPAHPTQHKNK